jgi:hypothetical protein
MGIVPECVTPSENTSEYFNSCSLSGSCRAKDSEGQSMYEEENKTMSFKSVYI